MRLPPSSIEAIRQAVTNVAGPSASVWLFGSRLDDAARGGDIDLLVKLPSAPGNPALMAATLSGCLSRAFHGRRVDVVLDAPGLARLPIHEVAERSGVCL
jgi:predicted nucleotidyltransferase